jgi:hypothetical protein
VFTKRHDPSEGQEAATCSELGYSDDVVTKLHPITEDVATTRDTLGRCVSPGSPFFNQSSLQTRGRWRNVRRVGTDDNDVVTKLIDREDFGLTNYPQALRVAWEPSYQPVRNQDSGTTLLRAYGRVGD